MEFQSTPKHYCIVLSTENAKHPLDRPLEQYSIPKSPTPLKPHAPANLRVGMHVLKTRYVQYAHSLLQSRWRSCCNYVGCLGRQHRHCAHVARCSIVRGIVPCRDLSTSGRGVAQTMRLASKRAHPRTPRGIYTKGGQHPM